MNSQAKNLVSAGMLVATGLILPMVFHTFAMGGQVFLPMHIPVLLGGFLLSPLWAALVGMLVPIISSIATGMPPLFPTALQMFFELAVYGFVVAYLYQKLRLAIYPSLIGGMLAGRTIAGLVNYVLLTHFLAQAFSPSAFVTAMFVTSLPGILIQLVMIPIMVKLLKTANVLAYKKGEAHER